jgi:hypothetical protein
MACTGTWALGLEEWALGLEEWVTAVDVWGCVMDLLAVVVEWDNLVVTVGWGDSEGWVPASGGDAAHGEGN